MAKNLFAKLTSGQQNQKIIRMFLQTYCYLGFVKRSSFISFFVEPTLLSYELCKTKHAKSKRPFTWFIIKVNLKYEWYPADGKLGNATAEDLDTY